VNFCFYILASEGEFRLLKHALLLPILLQLYGIMALSPHFLFSLDHRKNVSTCCEAMMMDRRLFPTRFNELELGGGGAG
jgi:hypothetical protein